MGLLELIVKTGIAEAIAAQLGGLKGNKNAIAETIENNVRNKIIKEHLSDPAFYEKMSALLDRDHRRQKGEGDQYEEYLRRVARSRRRRSRRGRRPPAPLRNSPALGRLQQLERKQPAARGSRRRIERASHKFRAIVLTGPQMTPRWRVKPDDFRGHQARENTIRLHCCHC
jgi:type I restriction enzyme R subunit